MIDRLYEKVGGRATINKLVQMFYDRVQADPRLAPFFPHTDMDTLRARQAMFLTMLLGGSKSFNGRNLTAAHAGARAQGLDDTHFDGLLTHFRESLQQLGVAPDYIQEMLRLLETTRNAVLGRAARLFTGAAGRPSCRTPARVSQTATRPRA